MIQRLLNSVTILVMLISCSSIFASPGALFTVMGGVGGRPFDVILCLNGQAGLSCQQFNVTSGALTIAPTLLNHKYTSIGLDILTPGFTVTTGCDNYIGNRCIFAASATSPTTLCCTPSGPGLGIGGASQWLTNKLTAAGVLIGKSDAPFLGC
jgi:hypothetical protein